MRFDLSESRTSQCSVTRLSVWCCGPAPFESGVRRSEMKKCAYDAGEMFRPHVMLNTGFEPTTCTFGRRHF